MAMNGPTWKWIAGSLLSIVLISGAAWVRAINADVQNVKAEQKQDRDAAASSREKVGVIEERTKRTEQDVREIKEDLKELLKRTPRR